MEQFDKSLFIRTLIKKKRLTQREVAEKLGIAPQQLSNKLTGVRPLDADFILKLKPILGDDVLQVVDMGEQEEVATPISDVGIPFMGEAEMVAAGDLAGFGQPITPAQATDNIILPALHFKPGDFAVSVRGRSMVDTEHPELSINDGAIVCLRPWNESFIRWGEIYCLFTTSGYAVKKLQPSDKDDCLMCVSSNDGEGYMPYKVSKAEIRGIAKVTAVINLQLF